MRTVGERLKDAWALINEPPLSPDRLNVRGNPLWQLFVRWYLKPHWANVLLIAVLASTTGLWAFVYSWAGKVIADDIVEVSITSTPPAPPSDPSLPGENRRFVLGDDDRHRDAVDTRIEATPGKTQAEKLRLLGWMTVALVANELFRHIMSMLVQERTIYVGQNVQFRLRQRLNAKLHALPMAYHDRHSPGRLLTHLFSDVGSIQQGMTEIMRNLPPFLVNIFIGLAVVTWINPKLSLMVYVALPCYAVVYNWFRERQRIVSENLREREGRLNAHISNRISSFQLVKSFRRETTEAVDYLKQSKPIMRNGLVAAMLNTGFVVSCALITGTCTTLSLWLGTIAVRDGQMTAGEMLMFFGAAGYLFTPIANLANMAGLIQRMQAVSQKVVRVLNEPVNLTEPETPAPIPDGACEVRLEDVTLKYDPQRPAAVSKISFTLPRGQRLCVMGPSGAGKSTLAKLLARLYDPTEGRILFNGIDVREFPVADLRKYIGFVSQEPIVFSGTIGANIRYGSERAAHQAMVAAAQYAQIHDFIEQLPARYHTLTHERGLTLSGGQKQRVNLARALLYNPMVLVLDDCTSALDADTEAKLVQGFQTVLKDRTAMLVSHRVSVAMGCDLVLMMDDGKVVEFGPPRELLERKGAFNELYREQFAKAGVTEPMVA